MRFVLMFLVAAGAFAAPMRVGVIGLVHGHVTGFMKGGALTPAGGALNRPDVEVVGVVEPDEQLFDSYAKKFGWTSKVHFKSIAEMAARVHPEAALVFTSTAGHTQAIEECATAGIHVMVEKPLAVSYQEALQIQKAAARGKIHVLVDYETSWYGSNGAARDFVEAGSMGQIVKTVVRDGHSGPKKIHVSPEFFAWLTDPKLNGAGALYDFGCYGADLMTWLMHGEKPISVTATTLHLQPEFYPKVEDESDVLVTYAKAVAILEGSWNWPFAVKDMDVYGQTGYVKTIGPGQVEMRSAGEKAGRMSTAKALSAPYDDPLHLMQAVIHGTVQEGDDLSSLKTNMVVSQILDAARRSAQTGQSVKLQ